MVLYVRKRELERKIMEYVERNPGTTIYKLAKDLGIEKELARYYIERMIMEGKLLGTIEPEEPYMSFRVEKIEYIGDNVRVSDAGGANIFETSRNHPLVVAGKIKEYAFLKVYEDRIEVQ
jgi:DNA-binding Lrp family transcriptional regulator